MNISQLKAFLGDKPQHLGNENSLQNQLRESGLKQALSLQKSQSGSAVDKFSSSTSLGVAIYANSFNSTLEVNRQKPDFSAPKPKEPEAALFDFEEVANNVLNFVGSVIKNAQNKGADESELSSLFEQATSGVLRGIKLAEQDLAGFLNEDIANGIEQSKALIDEGLDKLRQDVFNPDQADNNAQRTESSSSLSISSAQQQYGELKIRTRDGDQVTLSFEDFQQFEFRQQQLTETVVQNQDLPQQAENKTTPSETNTDGNAEIVPENPNAGEDNRPQENANSVEQINQTQQSTTSQSAVFYQQSSLSFSVQGELDEDELKAIGQLVVDTNDLAEEFFNGDIETAFNQALELGFDEQELAGFALQLTKVENTEVIKAYETVSRFDDDNVESEPAKAVKPVAEYLDKLLNVLDRSRLQLEDSKSYENVVNELINRLGDEVATPDLISAINRFNEFNQRLVDNIPIGYKPETQS